MSTRQRQIVKAILEVLNLMDGAQMNETILHAEVNLRVAPNATLVEFNDGLKVCAEQHAWATGIAPKFGGPRLWSLTDAGQAARLEMQ